jgi:hypothetical protein
MSISDEDYVYLLPRIDDPYTLIIISGKEQSFSSPEFAGFAWEISSFKLGSILEPSQSKSYDVVVELKASEVDEALSRQPLLIEILKEKGIREQDAEKMYQNLLEHVETKVQEMQLKLTEDTKKALANLMVLVAKRLDEET